jgi:hypothetical protein
MSTLLLIVALLLGPLGARLAGASEPPIELWMADGQLTTNPVRVYVTHTITLEMAPKLVLLGSHAVTARQCGENQEIPALRVAPGQTWEQPAPGGNRVQQAGTMLLFDLTAFPIPWFKSMMRLTPVLQWTENGVLRTAIATRAVNVGQPVTAWASSAALVVVALLAIVGMLGRRAGGLLVGGDGRLSLSRLQIAVWTIAVGAIVFGHGLIQLDVPSIPDSIVALMGLALVTGGISYLGPSQSSQQQPAPVQPAPSPAGAPAPPPIAAPPAATVLAPAPSSAPAKVVWSLADLVSDGGVPSISRAQMLFWTILMVSLFVVKSVLNGVVWEVPWAMVALMGISQGSYVVPKFVPPK